MEAAIDLKAELERALRRSRELGLEPERVHLQEVSAGRAGPWQGPDSEQELLDSAPWDKASPGLSPQVGGLGQRPGRRRRHGDMAWLRSPWPLTHLSVPWGPHELSDNLQAWVLVPSLAW